MFVESIATSDAAKQLLNVAGFKSSNAGRNTSKEGAGAGDGVAAGGEILTLVHSNSAILTLIVQVIHRCWYE